jgi:hypothetical protein
MRRSSDRAFREESPQVYRSDARWSVTCVTDHLGSQCDDHQIVLAKGMGIDLSKFKK